MAAVDDSRKVCHIVVIIDVVIVIIVIIVASPPLTFINPQTVKVLSAAPLGTPIAVFLENHKEEMELAIRQSQLMVTAACRIADAPHMTIPDKLFIFDCVFRHVWVDLNRRRYKANFRFCPFHCPFLCFDVKSFPEVE